ncbi:MAG: hypothetical protein QM571_00900 [Micrococcaceae bacterium]
MQIALALNTKLYERNRDAQLLAAGYNLVHTDSNTNHNPLLLATKLVAYVPSLATRTITKGLLVFNFNDDLISSYFSGFQPKFVRK